MDLESLEALALSEDRTAALAQLLPGSEDHDYYRCLHAQHVGALADAQQILDAWVERHGANARYERLRLRQQLCQLDKDPDRVADQVRDRFGVSHWHEREVAGVDPTRPTQIAEDAYDGARFLEAAAEHTTDLGQVSDDGLYELLERPLDTARRRALLARISHTPQPALIGQLAEDLAAKGSAGFGTLRIHNELTHEQLLALAERRPELRTHSRWIDAVVRRMRPPSTVDLELDRDARESYLVELWQFVSALSPASNSLKAHVLWHLLDTQRRRNARADAKLFAAYLQLPRGAHYISRKHFERARDSETARLGADFSEVTGLLPAGDDEELVRDLLRQFVDRPEQFAQWLDRAWLDAEVAVGHLLAGTGDADRAALTLGAERAAALREQIELAWCVHNPTRFGVDEPIVLEADVKHVPELVVKVFRIDPLAYFHLHHRELAVDVDLDGLAASHELVMRFSEPAIRRVRRRIELPMCSRAGTYVIDLIGNGMSSRAVVHKGRLRHLARVGAAGHVVTILDEHGKPRSDARAYLGEREYVPDEHGAFVVPFSTTGGTVPMLLSCGDVATVAQLELQREQYWLELALALDRQSLAAGRTARAIARVRLSVAGAPCSVALLEEARWDVTLVDRAGVATTKSQPLALSDDDAAVLEWPLGDDTAQVTISVQGKVKAVSLQRDVPLSQMASFQVAAMHATTATEALYLSRGIGGWTISALGKTGEPRGKRPVTVALVHRLAHTQWTYELATDERGRIELGELPGIVRILATLGSSTETWQIDDLPRPSGLLQIAAGRDAIVHLPASYDAEDAIRRASLVETRAGVPLRHIGDGFVPLAGAFAIRGLPPGEYVLRAPGVLPLAIRVARAGAELSGRVVTSSELVELSRLPPAISAVELGDALRVTLAGATAKTRVHVIATRFVPARVGYLGELFARGTEYRVDRARGATFVSGRELGDEYRYVLERRAHKRFPGLLLDKPTLLLNPWARRATLSDIATARAGGAFRARAPAAGAAAHRVQGFRPGPAEDRAAFVGYDFLADGPIVLANLVPDTGAIAIPLAQLAGATCATVIVDDPAGATSRRVALADSALAVRDLRLALALDPARHATQRKAIAPLQSGGKLVIEDLATAKVHLVDSVERAHTYLLALRDDPTLREFAFVTRWHTLPDGERRELYSKYACHELHLFLYFKDRAFFDAVVKPYLAHKRTKTFVDHWLLGSDVAPYLESDALARLNAAERALLAQRLRAEPAIARLLEDEVSVQAPDPALDTRLIDALLGAATLEPTRELEAKKRAAFADRMEAPAGESTGEMLAAAPAPMMGMAPAAPRGAPPRPSMSTKTLQTRAGGYDLDTDEEGPSEIAGEMDYDMRKRDDAPAPHYRAGERTQEWAEHNWWRRTPGESGASMIEPNRLWRDLARHGDGAFLSPWLGLATGSFAEAMCALAVTDLPFVAGKHAYDSEGPRMTITAGDRALAGSSQLVLGELVPGDPPLVVGQSYVRADDRHRFVDGEQVDKYVDGPLAAGVVYTCQVVLANPTSSRQRVSALVQIPRGSMALGGARQTHAIDVLLEPYGTDGHEYSFYFASPGRYTHFPVHVTRGGVIVAAAPARELVVTDGAVGDDTASWPHVSQHGSLDEVVAYLRQENLAAIELPRVAWRLRERNAYAAILGALEARRTYHTVLWGYALLHRDRERLRAWLRNLGSPLLDAGPVLDMPIVGIDAEALGAYEHLELAPLVNARAHRLGPKLRILNEGLAAQYRRFLDLVSHRAAPTPEDLLAAASYLLAQDRIEPALAALARVPADAVAERLQHDYLAAYAACLVGEVGRARELVGRWRDLPVDRWQRKHAALAAMLDELDGEAPAIVDPRSREQQHADLAARQPTFEIALDRDGVAIRHQHVAALELRFFEMDVELLFSRQPFVQSDVSRFSFIEPGHREHLTEPPVEHRVAWPTALRGKNVVVEAVGAGQRKAKIHYANDLATSLAHQVGQLRVQRASDRAALPATYVKVYARSHGGAVAFYKDGYTDLRGWFDYATLSTDDLDRVERFAILVCSDASGAAILETTPPQR
jgi:hypothetical protein